MKFAHVLHQAANEVPEYRSLHSFYKGMKKQLKRILPPAAHADGSPHLGLHGFGEAEERFVAQLVSQLTLLNTFRLERQGACSRKLDALTVAADEVQDIDQRRALYRGLVNFHGEALLLLHWGILAYTAIVKLLKKHHKHTGQLVQAPQLRAILSQSWSGEVLTHMISEAEAAIQHQQLLLAEQTAAQGQDMLRGRDAAGAPGASAAVLAGARRPGSAQQAACSVGAAVAAALPTELSASNSVSLGEVSWLSLLADMEDDETDDLDDDDASEDMEEGDVGDEPMVDIDSVSSGAGSRGGRRGGGSSAAGSSRSSNSVRPANGHLSPTGAAGASADTAPSSSPPPVHAHCPQERQELQGQHPLASRAEPSTSNAGDCHQRQPQHQCSEARQQPLGTEGAEVDRHNATGLVGLPGQCGAAPAPAHRTGDGSAAGVVPPVQSLTQRMRLALRTWELLQKSASTPSTVWVPRPAAPMAAEGAQAAPVEMAAGGPVPGTAESLARCHECIGSCNE